MKRTRQDQEYASLTDEGKGLYDEAIRCGAGHEDAMEAANYYGVQRPN